MADPRAGHVIAARVPSLGVILFSLVGGQSGPLSDKPLDRVYWANLTIASAALVVYTPTEDALELRLPVPLTRLGGACGRKTCAYIGGVDSGGLKSNNVTVFDEKANRDIYTLPSAVSDLVCAASPLTDVIVCAGGQDASGCAAEALCACALVCVCPYVCVYALSYVCVVYVSVCARPFCSPIAIPQCVRGKRYCIRTRRRLRRLPSPHRAEEKPRHRWRRQPHRHCRRLVRISVIQPLCGCAWCMFVCVCVCRDCVSRL